MTESAYLEREQSELKHYAIRLYLEAATRILASGWDVLKYVDCCAGPWNSVQSDFSDTSFGVAVEVLGKAAEELPSKSKAPRFACLLIEKDTNAFAQLVQYARKKDSPTIGVEAQNWDFAEHTTDIVRFCSTARTFPFILIDPWGWKLAGVSQIAPLLKLRGEVVINLMSSFITRFVKDNTTDFSDLLGDDFPELQGLEGSELEFAVVRKYCELVKREGGYRYVCALPVMKPDSDSFGFHLIYATRNAKGVEVFKSVERRTEEKTHVVRAQVQQRQRQERTGNLELFDAPVQYRERKYQQLGAENRERAQHEVLELLKSRPEVPYDDCWAESLQYSAVYEADLRTWIDEWEKAGAVAVTGKRPTERVLKRNAGHALRYSGIKSPNTP
jgi:three-Cys-motif partner protein